LLNISDESYGSDSEAFEMEERKLQISIGDLIKVRGKWTRNIIPEIEQAQLPI
jgi:hypothetical protein